MTFSTVAPFRAVMTVRQPAFLADAAILLLVARACGRLFTVEMLHWVQEIGM
jgi:hypothetical protein